MERGILTCLYGPNHEAIAVWTYDADAVLVVASDAAMYLDEIYPWWQATASEIALH